MFKSWEIRQFSFLVAYHLGISGLCTEVLFLFIYIYITVFTTGLLSHSVYIVTEISEWAAIHVFCYSYWPICDPHVVFTFNHYIEFKTINFSIGFLSIVAIISIWMPHKPQLINFHKAPVRWDDIIKRGMSHREKCQPIFWMPKLTCVRCVFLSYLAFHNTLFSLCLASSYLTTSATQLCKSGHK